MSEPEWIESRHFTTGEIMDAGRIMGLTFPPEMELGAAWQEAEAALPEGWRLVGVGLQHDGQWWAEAETVGVFDGASGPTPAAALRALAAKLRERAG